MAGRGWSKELLLLPLYSFVQSMIIAPYAMINYVKLARKHKSLGRINFDTTVYPVANRLMFSALNFMSATFVIYVAAIFTVIRVAYWMQNSFWL